MAKRRLIQLTLLLLLSSSSAWAQDGARDEVVAHEARWLGLKTPGGVGSGNPLWKRMLSEPDVMAVDAVQKLEQDNRDLERKLKEAQRELRRRRTPTEEEEAQITTAPPFSPDMLLRRQSQQQIDDLNSRLQSAQQSAQSALQSLSQSSRQVSQASQQLSQSSQQLSQSASRFSTESQRLSQSLQQAQQSAQQASESADRAVSSAQSSMSVAIASNLASATSSAGASAASVIAAASGSAQSVMSQAASMVQAAKADATLARADAQNEIVQAKGAAVSMQQVVIAVVATFVGSSVLTIIICWLVLRIKREKRRRSRELSRRDIGYPRTEVGQKPGYASSQYGPSGFLEDVKEPLSPPRADEQRMGGMGYATSTDERMAPVLGNPPPPVVKKAQTFTLFPRTPSTAGVGTSGPGVVPQSASSRSSIPPTLQNWLQAGTTVSPFGTLQKSTPSRQNPSSPGWPFERKQSAIGVGGVNASVGQAGVQTRKLPLRDD